MGNYKILLSLFFMAAIAPLAVAQTGGPGQPEFAQFQQAGADGLVSPSTGGFSQNISLFSIGGYPMNLTYQSTPTMEEVSSMVGLGWNLNAGAINRNLRGLPDDFNGENDFITRYYNVKPNITYGGKYTVTVEFAGIGDREAGLGIGLEAGLGMSYNNYTGLGLERSLSGNLSAHFSLGDGVSLAGGVGMGVSSNTRTGVDKYTSSNLSLSAQGKNANFGLGMGKTTSVNSLEGQRESMNVSMSLSMDSGSKKTVDGRTEGDGRDNASSSIGANQTSYLNDSYNPDIQFPFHTESGTFSVMAGADFYMVDPGARINGYYSIQSLLKKQVISPAFGAMYENEADIPVNALLDFNREKNLPFFANQSKILPVPFKTPDVFSLQAQGLSMTFSVNKSDIGVYGDPEMYNNSIGAQGGLELHFGGIFKAGGNIGTTSTEIRTGRWKPTELQPLQFVSGRLIGNSFEPFSLYNHSEVGKDANTGLFTNLNGYKPLDLHATSAAGSIEATTFINNSHGKSKREVRQSDIQHLTAEQAAKIGLVKEILSYPLNNFTAAPTIIARNSGFRKPNHLSEISVKQPDGSRYIFGLPTYNVKQKEVSFAVTGNAVDPVNNLVGYTSSGNNPDNSLLNSKGRDNFFEATETPAYVTSWLITAVLSADYVDLTGDGPTADDLGGYVKFNYAQDKTNYGWRTPYEQNKANFNGGLNTVSSDNKANYVYGEKETWYLHSMESKSERAEFSYSPRNDGLGVLDENGGANPAATLQKLDQVRIFSLSERNTLGANAVPIKTILFSYDESLCKGVHNQAVAGQGKLSLKGVSIRLFRKKRKVLCTFVL